MRYIHGLALPLVLAFAACGSDSTSAIDATPEVPHFDAAPSIVPDSAPGFALAINNFDDWCVITVNGAPFTGTESFPAGTVVNLHAGPGSGFVWGYWTGTDGDTGSNDTNMTTTVTMTADKSLLACCPFPPPASQVCQ